MMASSDRRTALQLTIAAALAPALGTRQALATEAPNRLIAPPSGEMLYTRRLVHQLDTASNISVSRSFSITFVQAGAGYAVVGRQVAVEVDAPPALARFVAMENARDESALFPITLDAFGRIHAATFAAPPAGDVQMAVEEALHQLSGQPLASDEQQQVAQFVGAMRHAGQRVTAWLPADLFAPEHAPRVEERRIALPGGAEGSVAMTFAGQRDPLTGLMREARREVTTSVDGESARNTEHWSLSSA